MTKPPHVFISYSSADRHHAERLVSSLLLNAVQVWYDQRDIEVGQNIYEKIHDGLIKVDFLGVVLTPHSIKSAWVKEELSLAKQRELEEQQVIILPLFFDKVTPPLHLRARKYADFSNFDSGFRELMRALNRHIGVKALDDALLKRVREGISALGSRTATHVQAVRSQNMARIVRGTALPLEHIAKQLASDFDEFGYNPARIFVDVQSAGVEIPIIVDLEERCSVVLARVLQAIGLDELVLTDQRFSFFLVYEGIPLELDETLTNAGVQDGSHLQLGAYTFLIE